MKRLIPFALVLAATACGSTGTDSSGTGDDDDTSSGFSCSSFQAGLGIICDNTTSPPTIRVDFGTGAGQAVPGDDPRLASIDPNKGKWIASFLPSATEAPAGTVLAGPTGAWLLMNPVSGKIGVRGVDELCKLKNAAFPNAHMCTNDELLWNVRNGFITNGMSGMAYGTHSDPGLGGVRNSFKASCGGLTYNTADLQYTGTRWEAVNSDPKAAGQLANATVLNFVGAIPCNTTGLAIACCQ